MCRPEYATAMSFIRAADLTAPLPSTNRKTQMFGSPARILLCVFLLGTPLLASNHPEINGRNANCALCHSDMTRGESVHSQGELACTLCHSWRTDGESVEMSLTGPRQALCFACHERSAMGQHTSSTAKKECLECHDAHNSTRAMLLRRNVELSYAQPTPHPADSKDATRKVKSKSIRSDKRHGPQHPQATDHQM